MHEISKLQETTAVLNIDEGSVLNHVSWSEDGRLLAAITSDGCVHLYLEALPMLSSSYNNCVAFLTSLNEVTIHYCHSDKVSSSKTILKFNLVLQDFIFRINHQIWYL